MIASRRVLYMICRWSARVLGASAVLVAATGAARAVVTVDYTAMGALTLPGAYFANCGVVTRSTGDLLVNVAAAGLAVAGGSEMAIDGAESVSFEFNANGDARVATQVSIRVAVEPGGDADATPGEISVSAYGPGEEPLGSAAFSGEGVHDVSAAFGGQSIALLVVAPDPDPVRILDLSYQPPGGAAIEVDFFAIGDLDVSSLTLCGITLSGSSALHVAGSGVGVIGGDGDSYVDSGETLGIELDQPTVALRYRPWSAIGGSPIAVPFTLEAFDAEAQSLGALPLSFTTMLAEVDVTALYAGAEIASFELVGGPPNQGGQGLGFVSYAVAPEPTTLAVGAAAGAALAALARKRARRGAS